MGVITPPKKVSGGWSDFEPVRKRHGWSNYKFGVPRIKWSNSAKVCENHSPTEYFEEPEHKYTTLARQFRKDWELPEIPEYADLSEEEIVRLCKKADEQEMKSLSSQEQYDRTRDTERNLNTQRAIRDYWEKTEYIPYGALWIEALGDDNYTGPQRDFISTLVSSRFKDDMNAAQKYNMALAIKEVAIKKECIDKHPEVDELILKYRKEMEEQHLERLPYESIWHSRSREMTLRMNGEVNPWGIVFEEQPEDLISVPLEDLERIGYTQAEFTEFKNKWLEENQEALDEKNAKRREEVRILRANQ